MNYTDELDAHLNNDCWPGCRACDDPMDPDLPTRTTQDLRRIFDDDDRKWRSRAMAVVCVLLATAWVVFVAMDLARAAGV